MTAMPWSTDEPMIPETLDEPSVTVRAQVNGRSVTELVPTRMHAADFLRQRVGLTGTHIGCEQGVCGMCTVIVDGVAVKSCLMLAPQLDGAHVETVESLADEGDLSSLQQLFQEEHALQCGFCSPGFLMAATALSRRDRSLSRAEIVEELSGVMCRCTGYEGIVNAVCRRLLGETNRGRTE